MWKEKLSSRKFWMAVVSGVLVILNEGLDWGIPVETVKAFVQLVLGYILIEGARDVARALKG